MNELISEISLGDNQLLLRKNIFYSLCFFLDLSINHSGLSEFPFLILNKEESSKRRLEVNICALLNADRGGVILMGCELHDDEDSLILKKVDQKYLQ